VQNKIFNVKTTLIILGLCIILIASIYLIFNKKHQTNDIQQLYSVKVRGYKLDKEFNEDIYEYALEVEDNFVDISCESNVDIDGCNVRINLENKENYLHLINVFNNRKVYTYKINITKKENPNDSTIQIETINGNPLEWTNKNIVLEILMQKNDSYLFSLDDGLTWQESNKFEVTNNGQYKLTIKKSDNSEFVSKLIEVDKIDKTSPSGTFNKYLNKNKVIIDISTYDELSGIDGISFNGGNYSLKTQYETNKPGKYYVQFKDKAGNISDKYYVEVTNTDFGKSEPLKKYTLELDANGSRIEKNSVYCETNKESCEVILPNIFSNDEIVGWGENSTSTEPLYIPGQKIILTNNLKLYAITKKQHTALFANNGVAISMYKSLTCAAYNGGTCKIRTPEIITNWEIIGWSTNKTAKTADISAKEMIELASDVVYYPITKKEYTATFGQNGEAVSSTKKMTCTAYNGGTCKIRTPEIITNWEIIGWSTNKTAKTANISVKEMIELPNDVEYYPITKKIHTAKFYHQNLDYIESKELSCIAYNGGSCKIILPYFNKVGYFNSFWSTDSVVMEDLKGKTKLSKYFLSAGKSYTLTKDITLYPNFNHIKYYMVSDYTLYNFRKINTIVSANVKYGESIFEFENGLSLTTISNFKKFVSNLYNKFPC